MNNNDPEQSHAWARPWLAFSNPFLRLAPTVYRGYRKTLMRLPGAFIA